MDPHADPTAALAMIRALIRDWELTDREPTGVLLYLVDKLDCWLLQGAHLPEQWTSPDGWPWDEWGHWTATQITDPDRTLVEIREVISKARDGLPHDPHRLMELIAGLDMWVMTQSGNLPRPWVTTTK